MAEASESVVTLGAFGEVVALSCVLVKGSLFGWPGNEGKCWAGRNCWMEEG